MYYWGIFPKSKNRINYASVLKEITTLCEVYYSEDSAKQQKDSAKKELINTYRVKGDHKFVYKANEIDEQQHEINLSFLSKSDLSSQ